MDGQRRRGGSTGDFGFGVSGAMQSTATGYFLWIMHRTENREQKTENREQRTENREQSWVFTFIYYYYLHPHPHCRYVSNE
jgi:hypothetical protein